MRRCGFSPSLAIAGGLLTFAYFLHFCLFRFPPSPDGTCVMSTVYTASLQCWPKLNGSRVRAGVTVGSKLRKGLSSREAPLSLDQDILSWVPSYRSVASDTLIAIMRLFYKAVKESNLTARYRWNCLAQTPEWQITHKRKFTIGMGLQPEHPFYKEEQNGWDVST